MTLKILAFFEEHGTEIKSESNTSLLLNTTDRVFCVAKGKMNLFYSALDTGNQTTSGAKKTEPDECLKTNQLTGHKSHVFTALPGDVLWGHKNCSALSQVFVGMSHKETLLYSMEREKLSGHPEILTILVETWIAHLFSGLQATPRPKNSIRIVDEKKLPVPCGTSVYKGEGFCWLEFIEGSFIYQDMEDLPLQALKAAVPLTGPAWLTANTDGIVQAVTTDDLIRDGRLLSCFDNFQEQLLSLFCLKEKTDGEKDAELLTKKKESEEAYIHSSLMSLADVINLKKPPFSRGPSEENPLFAALKTLGNAMGIEIVLPKKNQDNLDSIIDASHVRTRKVVLSGNWWNGDNGALLGFLEESSTPVALIPEKRTRYRMWNPLTDAWESLNEALAARIKPFAWTLYKPFPYKKLGAFDLIRFGLENIWKSDAVTVIVVGLLSGLLALLIPIATGLIFDSLIPQAERNQLLQLGLFLALGAVSGFIFELANSVASLRMESRMNISIQASVWDRLLGLPIPFFRDFNTGDLAIRTNSINSIRRMLSGVAMTTLVSGIFSIFNFIVLFYYSGSLAVIAAVLVLVSIVLAVISGLLSFNLFREVSYLLGKLSGLVLQLINGITKLRVAGALNRAFHRWTCQFSRKRKVEFKVRTIGNIFAVFQNIFPLVCSLVIFFFVVTSPDIRLSPGNFLAFSAAFSIFMYAMLSLSSTFISLLVIIPQFDRAQPILKALPEWRGDKSDPGELSGSIEVNHLYFRYNKSGPLVLEDISFRVRPGELVALVGHSGSGKSTLLRLLLGFEQASSGAIYIDGLDLSTLDLSCVRRQIGTVLQGSRILSGDIFHTIIGTQASLTIDDAWKAAEMVGLADDIREMPMGMFTIIGEGGSTISGGQRQKLLVARAIVAKPRILFFDEATSALDNRTQNIVSRSLESLNATRIVIAHRLSTIIEADRIVVLEKGRIAEQGSYKALLAHNKAFAELVRRQLA